MSNYRLSVVPAGAAPGRVDSKDIDLDLHSVRIGADNLPLVQDGTGVSARLKSIANLIIPTATQTDEAATWGQTLDYVNSQLSAREWQQSVLSRLDTPPLSPPTEGDRYMIIPTASGAWVGHDQELVEWKDGVWVYTVCTTGTYVFVDNEEFGLYGFNGTQWNEKKFDKITASQGLLRSGDDIQIATSGVTDTKIAAGAVTNNKIAASAVTLSKMAADSVDTTQLVANSVTEAKISASAVTEAKIGTGAVTEDKIGTNAVTSTKVGTNAIYTDAIQNSAVTEPKIADSAVTNGKIALGAVSGNKILIALRARLGLQDTAYNAYSSANVVNTNDSYPQAISNLDAAVTQILTNSPQEEHFVAPVGGMATLTCTTISWNADDAEKDIVVRVNGKLLDSVEEYTKTSTTELSFTFTIPENAHVVVRKERTGAVSTGGGGGITGITVEDEGSTTVSSCVRMNFVGAGVTVTDQGLGEATITVLGGGGNLGSVAEDIIPGTNNSRALGAPTLGWKELFLSDKATGEVYRVEIVNGIFQAEKVV